jgi:Bacteriophage lambda head decoration protein D
MPTDDSFEFDYVPGYTKPTHEYGTPFGDEFHAENVAELLASSHRFTQRGMTIAGGQGALPTGAVMARHTASGQYFLYDPAATDGRQIPLGFLRNARDTGGNGGTPSGYTFTGDTPSFAPSPSGKVATNCLGNLLTSGIVNLAQLSGQDTTSLVSQGSWGNPPVTGPTGVSVGTLTNTQTGGASSGLGGRIDLAGGTFTF